MSGTADEIFVAARKVSAAQVMQAHDRKVAARGLEARSACPLCGAGDASKSEPFVAQVRGALWHCHACGDGGDSIRLELLLGQHPDLLSAARILAGQPADAEALVAPRREPVPVASAEPDSARAAAWLRRTAGPATGSPVETWLRTRGLDPQSVPGGLAALRWHAFAPVASWEVREPSDKSEPARGMPRCAAMVAPLSRVSGTAHSRVIEPAGVHVTYLTADGLAKANLKRRDNSAMPGRKFFGDARHAAALLTDLDGPGPLLVGEGIETVWAVADRFASAGQPFRAVATLSLNNLQGGVLGYHDSRAFRLAAPESDPERPPFVVQDPGDVIILVDADMKPIQARVCLSRRATPTMRLLSSIERAELCGALAAQAWRRSGARSVRVVRARLGRDFNDAVRELL